MWGMSYLILGNTSMGTKLMQLASMEAGEAITCRNKLNENLIAMNLKIYRKQSPYQGKQTNKQKT
jgi:hypothetical protein